jgi:hypothetical protein
LQPLDVAFIEDLFHEGLSSYTSLKMSTRDNVSPIHVSVSLRPCDLMESLDCCRGIQPWSDKPALSIKKIAVSEFRFSALNLVFTLSVLFLYYSTIIAGC